MQEAETVSHSDPLWSGPVRLLRVREVSSKTGLSRAYIYKLERQGGFPKRRRLSEARVGWLEHEVDAWCLSRPVVNLVG